MIDGNVSQRSTSGRCAGSRGLDPELLGSGLGSVGPNLMKRKNWQQQGEREQELEAKHATVGATGGEAGVGLQQVTEGRTLHTSLMQSSTSETEWHEQQNTQQFNKLQHENLGKAW